MKKKRMELSEAIKTFIRPGMTIHLAGGFGGPSAAICEIIREFKDKNPGFVLIQSTVTGHALSLLHLNLLRKLIFSASIDISDTARPSKIMVRSYREKNIEIENWSLLSLQLRLMASALRLPFLPTRSLISSSMEIDNKNAFLRLEDPFGSKETVGLLKALSPDISIVHGLAGDEEGNIILSVPYGDDIFGAFASKGGVIATVEKIIPKEMTRKYAPFVKIPGNIVLAVCEAEFGLHPFYLFNPGVETLYSYEVDMEFLREMHESSLSPQDYDFFIKKWVIEPKSHEGYLRRLGRERLERLKEGSKKIDKEAISGLSEEKKMMAVALSRMIMERVKENGHKFLLAGAGSHVAGIWLAYDLLKKSGHEVYLITGNGQIGFEPSFSRFILPDFNTIRTSRMFSDTLITQGIFVGGRSDSISVIGAGQIDRYGNINSTLDKDGNFLVGSGGANDVMNAAEVIVVIEQSKDRFLSRLPYITSSGRNVTTVVSSMGVFQKEFGNKELVLTACFPYPKTKSLEEKIREIRRNCGFEFKIAEGIREMGEPTEEERSFFEGS